MAENKFYGIRIADKLMKKLPEHNGVGLTFQDIMRSYITIMPKIFKLMADHQIDAPTFYFTDEEKKILEGLYKKLKEEKVIK